MTNPNNAIGTNGAYGGRTSVNAFNDDLAIWSGRGVMSGWACSPNSGMTVQIGGVSGTRDVAIAQDNAGNRTTINNISGSPVQITIDTAPSTNSRIDSIVAYVDNPATGTSTDVDNPGTCGIIAVKGTVASSPSAPNDSAIRTAITGDGASGSTAYYVVLANITVGTNVTVIQSSAISVGGYATIQTDNIGNTQVTASKLASNSVTTSKINNGAVTSAKIDFTTFGSGNYSTSERQTEYKWIDGKYIYKKTINFGALPNATAKNVNHNISSISNVINIEGFAKYTSGVTIFIPNVNTNSVGSGISISVSTTQITIDTGSTDRSEATAYITIYYTKTS